MTENQLRDICQHALIHIRSEQSNIEFRIKFSQAEGLRSFEIPGLSEAKEQMNNLNELERVVLAHLDLVKEVSND